MDVSGRYYVPGYIVAPGCDETLADDKFFSCPLADVIRPGSPIRQVFDTHRTLEVEGIRLVDLHKSPTPGLIAALAELDITVRAYRNEKERRAVEEMKRRANRG
jgi:hypothetical protein